MWSYGTYVSESDFVERDWQRAFWGSNYPRLAELKRTYDPGGLFFAHPGAGSEEWTDDGFRRLKADPPAQGRNVRLGLA